MRILFVAWRDLANPAAGGSEVLIDRLAAGLVERGHEVALLCAGPVEPRAYRVHRNGSGLDQYLRAPFAYHRHFAHYDLAVDVANGMPFFVRLWRRGPTVCFVNHLHGAQWRQWFGPLVAGVGRFMEERLMPLVYQHQLVVAVSPSTAEGLGRLGVPESSIRFVRNGADIPAVVRAPSQTPLFLCLGRMVPHKQQQRVLRVWEQVRPVTGGRLVMVGDGPTMQGLQAFAGPGVEFTGWIDAARKARLLGEAWLLVHGASQEGWGLVINEAAAHATPTLGFRVPGVRDAVLDGETGVLVDDEDQMAEEWIRLAGDAALRTRLGEAARARVAGFAWERTIDQFLAVADEAVSGGRAAANRSVRAGRAPAPHLQPARVSPAAPSSAGRSGDDEQLGGVVLVPEPGDGRAPAQPDFTVIVPAYNEAARLPASLPELVAELTRHAAEIVVVDDGSSDGTAEVASGILRGIGWARVVRLPHHLGKGAAVRAGVAAASGRSVVFVDADNAVDAQAIPALVAELDAAHVVIGSRGTAGAVATGLVGTRRMAHLGFKHAARLVTRLQLGDFQCGFKAFRAPAAKLLFHLQEEDGMAFDVEVLSLAARLGYRIHEVPVQWTAIGGGHTKLAADSVAMASRLGRLGLHRPPGTSLAALQATGEGDAAGLAVRLGSQLAGHPPVVPWGDGVLALLPFTAPAQSKLLARDLERRLPDLLVQPALVDARLLFDPPRRALREALAAL